MRVIMRPNVHIQPDPFFFIWWSLRYYNIHDTCQPTIMQKCSFNSSTLYQSLETSILFCWPSYDGTTEKKKYIFEQFLSEVQANFDLRTPLKDMSFWRCLFGRNEVCLIKLTFKWRSKYLIWKLRCSANFRHLDQCF